MLVLDVKAVSEAVHKVRADIIVAVDNSFVTPYLQVGNIVIVWVPYNYVSYVSYIKFVKRHLQLLLLLF